MNITRRQLLLIIALALTLLIGDFCVELLAPDVADWLKSKFGETYKHRLWLILPLAVVAGLLIGNWQDWFKKEQYFALGESNSAKLIEALKKKYKQRIGNKLAGRFPVNLRIVTSMVGTSDEGKANFISLKNKEVRHEIGEIFDRASGRLLVVGLPGAGKTTLLLQLALELLRRAEGVSHFQRIPVLLNLATWRTEFKTLDEWLRRILPNELGTSKPLAEKIRTNNQLILLFDGLDEVPESDRNSCLEAIGKHGMIDENQYVISTRITEYAAAIDAKNINHQVEVAPLDAEQIETNLSVQAGINLAGARALYNSIKGKEPQDALLKQAIENPFYLNTAQLLFASGKNWSEFSFAADDVVGREQELVKTFIDYTLGHKIKRYYLVKKAENWLRFLAKKMEIDALRTFELMDLKSTWSDKTWTISFLTFVLWIFCSAFPFFLIDILLSTFLKIFSLGAFSHPGYNDNNSFLDIIFDAFYRTFKLGVVLGTPIGVYFILESKKFIVKIPDRIVITILCLFLLLFLREAVMGVIMLWLSLIVLFRENTLQHKKLFTALNPYHSLWISIWQGHPSIFVHIPLRLILTLESCLPLRLVRFLNEMSRRNLLEFDGNLDTESGGGAWRWRHRIIQEYFLKEKE